MYCFKCGNQLPDDAKFCANCGANVVEDNNIQNESADAKINDTIGDSTETGNENGEDKTTESTYLWYYIQGNDRKGPVTEKQILDLAKTGSINRTSLVWKDGFTDWVIAEKTVFILFPSFFSFPDIISSPNSKPSLLETLKNSPELVSMIQLFLPHSIKYSFWHRS